MNIDGMAKTGKRLIHAVVNKFIHQMMQTTSVDVANVHTGALANMVGIPQDLNIVAVVFSVPLGA
jgi:hypothetical protein